MLLSQLCIWKRRKGHVGPAWARVLRERKIALESSIKLTPELSRRKVRPRGRQRETLNHGVQSTPALYLFLAEVVQVYKTSAVVRGRLAGGSLSALRKDPPALQHLVSQCSGSLILGPQSALRTYLNLRKALHSSVLALFCVGWFVFSFI